jgi:redox-sensitive bicupin YhaK (pirin superfamily)
MFTVRPASQRGHANHGWLDTWHSFSFNTYRDPRYMHFRSLRVMNEDIVAPGQGFGTHPHNDMEIVTYVLSGALEHKDSMGHGEVLRPGEFQRMTAGTGITHSEFNPSATEPVHLYQIWLFPERKDLPPSYEQKAFPASGRRNQWQLVASRDAALDSLTIHTDARIFLAELDAEQIVRRDLEPSRHAWLQILRGAVQVSGQRLMAGDGLAVSDESSLEIMGNAQSSELMLFDLA